MQRGDPANGVSYRPPLPPPLPERRSVRPWHVNVALAAFIVSLVLGAVSLGAASSRIDGKLDRNCRTLNTIVADQRFQIILETNEGKGRPGHGELAKGLRAVFRNSGLASC